MRYSPLERSICIWCGTKYRYFDTFAFILLLVHYSHSHANRNLVDVFPFFHTRQIAFNLGCFIFLSPHTSYHLSLCVSLSVPKYHKDNVWWVSRVAPLVLSVDWNEWLHCVNWGDLLAQILNLLFNWEPKMICVHPCTLECHRYQ